MYPRSPVERNMALGKNSQFSGAGLKEAQDGAGKAGRGKTKAGFVIGLWFYPTDYGRPFHFWILGKHTNLCKNRIL